MRARLAAWLLALLGVSPLHAADHAVVLLYHHVDAQGPDSTSVTPALFARHLDYLAQGGYTVLPLGRIVRALASGVELPDKTVAITFDDAYHSILDQAAPMLKKHGWPFTIFVSTQAIDAGYRGYLSWDELSGLVNDGAEIGNHSDSHDHLVRHRDGESDHQWQSRVRADIQRAQHALERHLGVTPVLFAYPYGEYTDQLQAVVAGLGYAGVAQQSGAVDRDVDELAIPRFPMAGRYADMQRFAISVDTRPLPVRDVAYKPRIQTEGQTRRQHFAFDLLAGAYRPGDLACYGNDGEKLSFTRQNANGVQRISMPLPAWAAGRRKINCTAPSSKEQGVFYWYSQQWLVKRADGSWYEE